MDFRYLLAVDPSLTCSGWALLSIKTGEILGVGKIRSLPPCHHLSERLLDLQSKIHTIFAELKLGPSDLMICEAPTTMRDPRAALKVEQVRCIFEAVARQSGLKVPGRLNPRSVQYEVMGLKGKQLKRCLIKETARRIAVFIYNKDLVRLGFPSDCNSLKKNQDIVDALLIGHLAVQRVKSARVSGQKIENFFCERARL